MSEIVKCAFTLKPIKSRKSTPHSSKYPRAPKKGSSCAKSTPKEVDIFSLAAMENLYYISHNAMDCLTFRGFGWSQVKKKKKKGTKQKGKEDHSKLGVGSSTTYYEEEN